MASAAKVVGRGSTSSALAVTDIREIVENALRSVSAKAKVLAIIPDTSRDDNTQILFPLIDEVLRSKAVDKFDALVAQGTHPPISDREKLEKIGLESFTGDIFDHEWKSIEQLVSIGRLDEADVYGASRGEFAKTIEIALNRLVLDYDVSLVLGATTPHEVVGFSGGAKYFFPGISGAELTNATHWLGALAGIQNIIGQVETPTRHLIEKAADHIKREIINFSSAISRDHEGQLQTDALFAGDFRASFRKAAEVSQKVNIKFVDRTYRRVVAILDQHYRDLWTGGKASYKLGGIIEDGGELVIYAPHLNEISKTHGSTIQRYGYAPIERIKKIVAGSDELRSNLCVAAHLAHVSYSGSEDDPLRSKYKITMASALGPAICEKVGLGFADHNDIDLAAMSNDAETLVVEYAGRDLYLLDRCYK
jgi:nickel-dependent lactate racemase